MGTRDKIERGLLYLVFGAEYGRLAAHTIAHSQQFTDLPVHVVTNRELTDPKWADCRVTTTVLSIEDHNNRDIKTSICRHTPFELTCMLDVDCVIQRPGVERIFDVLGTADMAFWNYGPWDYDTPMPKFYIRYFRAAGLEPPFDAWSTGFFAFRNNDRVRALFDHWHVYRLRVGGGRDMPALAAVSKARRARDEIHIAEIPPDDLYSPRKRDPQVVVQHDPPKGFPADWHIPQWISWKPTVSEPQDSWQKVTWRVCK